MTRKISKDVTDKIIIVDLIKIIKCFPLWGTQHIMMNKGSKLSANRLPDLLNNKDRIKTPNKT